MNNGKDSDARVEDELYIEKLSEVLDMLQVSEHKSRNRSLAITHLEDSIARLYADLKEREPFTF